MKALLFDVDGTLADTEEAHRRAFNAAFRAHGLNWCWNAELYSDLLRVTGGKERIGHYIDRLALEAAEKERLVRCVPMIHGTKTVIYANLVQLGGVPLRAGIRRLIEEARAAGIAVVIASTTTFENVKALITACLGADALRWFATIACGDVVKRKKPAPDIYEFALASIGIGASHAVAFEDSEIGVESAKAARLFTVATPNRWTAEQRFDAADLVLPSLGDPDEPLNSADAERIGAHYLSLEQLRALHSNLKEPA